MMRAIHLDFQARRPLPWKSLLLLMTGIAIAANFFLRHQSSLDAAARLETEIARAQGRADVTEETVRQEAANGAQNAEEIAVANAAIRQLMLPWEELFIALELASNEEVALLGIEPDAKKRIVRIAAESKTPAGMLNYLRRLQASPLLEEVVLQKHEEQTKDPEKPTRFLITSVWKERR